MMSTDVRQRVETTSLARGEIASKTRAIYETLLCESAYLDRGNFGTLHPSDLERMFDLYDRSFFAGGVQELLGEMRPVFRLSNRMTQAAGKVARRELRDDRGRIRRTDYEIAVSTTLLFQTFEEEVRPIIMSGIPCRDRLEALQRVMEHEIVHLVELVVWDHSSCSRSRFQGIANRFFSHTDHRHQLITPRERAFLKYQIKTGDRVSFRFDGRHFTGVVNRITKRATVLVEDDEGTRYSDGRRYAKFYVPVSMLEPEKPA